MLIYILKKHAECIFVANSNCPGDVLIQTVPFFFLGRVCNQSLFSGDLTDTGRKRSQPILL